MEGQFFSLPVDLGEDLSEYEESKKSDEYDYYSNHNEELESLPDDFAFHWSDRLN